MQTRFFSLFVETFFFPQFSFFVLFLCGLFLSIFCYGTKDERDYEIVPDSSFLYLIYLTIICLFFRNYSSWRLN